MARLALDDYKIKVTKKDCEKGFHGVFEVTADSASILVEQCIVCGKKAYYQKIYVPGITGQMNQKLDEDLYRKNHKIDFLQPWLPDGTANPDFFTYYGDPRDIQARLQATLQEDSKSEFKDLS